MRFTKIHIIYIHAHINTDIQKDIDIKKGTEMDKTPFD